ncbi:hypothetical protein F8M41_010358 [Gigaspora margarita]|uniref:Protein kinase domain-containing protein n=1 Tax=Gigaspora margarita TaxID=4874 RepID=A0A8H4A2I5_GIGMA|nr:hypothetical protein F8M41_010358 [Gigaspora margarita]
MYINGNLNNFLKKKKDFKYLERITILGWIASGLLTMHENSQKHCDLHSGKILIKYNNDPNFERSRYLDLIADFEQSGMLHSINSLPTGDLLVVLLLK